MVRVDLKVFLIVFHFYKIILAKTDIRSFVKPITSPIDHGEGPFWNHKEQALYYVNTFAPAILKWEPFENKTVIHNLSNDSVGFIVPIENNKNKFVVCRDRNIDLFVWDGKTNNSGILQQISFVDVDKPRNQFNDGKVDAKGRLWAGTLTRNEDLSVEPNGGTLYSIEESNLNSPQVMIQPVSISNGLVWSKDNKRFFFIDSETRMIVMYSFNLNEGTIENPRVLFDLKDHEDLQGIPDGMTIDVDDNLWIALYGGKSVIKVNSNTGKLMETIKIPVTYVTSVTFGGPNFDLLYVTTSRLKLTEEEATAEPYAGSVFAIYNLGTRGYPAGEFKLKLD